jgi:quercetin 2,3-dioxygenase
VNIRLANSRGHVIQHWIQSRRTFSNNSYRDPRYKGCGSLVAINDDTLHPGYMIPKHEHNNLDILGYMVEGELEHWDTCGNLSRAKPSQVQHMWCGSSIWHTEKCISPAPARYLQIWLKPKQKNTAPAYYELINKSLEFGVIDVVLKSDVKVSGGILNGSYSSDQGYLYLISGDCLANGIKLQKGDGAELTEITKIESNLAHIILFENT